MKYLFESLPLALAVMAIIAGLSRYATVGTRNGRIVLLWMVVNAALMLVAQASWWHTALVLNSQEGEMWANVLWTIFNSSVMAKTLFVVTADFRWDWK